MEKKRLLQTLQQLQEELMRSEQVDPETLRELEQLTSDVRRSVEEHHADVPDEDTAHGLRSLLLKYEADHPQLAVSIGRVADALAAMGI